MRKTGLSLVLLAMCGCGGGSGGATTVHVAAGQSIQAAIDAAPPNAIIMVEPGVYHESATAQSAVVVTKDNLHVVGLSTRNNPVVLENAGGQNNGFWTSPGDSVDTSEGEHPPCGESGHLVHGFTLEGFTVRGFQQYGVYLACVDGFTLDSNLADADLVYGLFPVRSHRGTMSNNEVQGTTLDSALYVGQSDHVTVSGNRAHDNMQGLEIENCSDVTATDNELFDNTAGLIADIMPHLQKTDQTNVLIAHNNVHDNNRPATPGDENSTAPPGLGIVIVGGSMVTVQSNTVANNGFQGIIVSSYCTGVSGGCTNIDVDPDPQNDHILDNQLLDNGNQPPPIYASFAADMLWDRQGQGNCWSGNTPSATVVILGSSSTTLPACS